jgi:hypothetical protein
MRLKNRTDGSILVSISIFPANIVLTNGGINREGRFFCQIGHFSPIPARSKTPGPPHPTYEHPFWQILFAEGAPQNPTHDPRSTGTEPVGARTHLVIAPSHQPD